MRQGMMVTVLNPPDGVRPESQSKLALLFFMAVVGLYTVIIQHSLYLPIHPSGQHHRKHMRVEREELRAMFQTNNGVQRIHIKSELFSTKSFSVRGSFLAKAPAVLPMWKKWDAENMRGLKAVDDEEYQAQKMAVRAAMGHSFSAYERHAFGMDELQPLSESGKDAPEFGGMGATLVDALSTLWLMDMKDEFERGRTWVANQLRFDKDVKISLFEVNIRILGGLLSAWDLSRDPVFLDKAQELADKLMPAFRASPSGIPQNWIQLRTAGVEGPDPSVVASISEIGTLGLEFLALSLRTGNPTYGNATEHIYRALFAKFPAQGLVPSMLNRLTLGREDVESYKDFGVGAFADSYYEYLLKMWLAKHKQDESYRARWEAAMDDVILKLVAVSQGPKPLQFVGELKGEEFSPKMQHLACFLPGNLGLGVVEGAVKGPKADAYLALARNLTLTCWQMYERQPTGLAGEMVWFPPGEDMKVAVSYNVLRPETVESVFYLWRITHDPVYRDWGWRIFLAFQAYSRRGEGYSQIDDVTKVPPEPADVMPSFWMAETLKYLYLLFSPDSTLSLDEWVFNTEAHPLRLFPEPG